MGLSESLVDKGFRGNRQILHEKYDYPNPEREIAVPAGIKPGAEKQRLAA